MKPTVWYHVGYDYIMVQVSKDRIELGHQGSNWCEGLKAWVPDRLNLFTWKIDKTKWELHKIYGWLIELSDL